MNKIILLLGIFALFLISPVFADQINQSSCLVASENLTIIPSAFNITTPQNSTITYTVFTILFGECDARNMTWSVSSNWFLFAPQNSLYQHGSNTPSNIQILLPPLPTNQTNQTLSYNITLIGNNTPSKSTQLYLFIPYNVTNITETSNETAEHQLNFTDINDFINKLNREQLIYSGLLLDTILKGYNFSFIQKINTETIREIPVITQIPIEPKLYLDFLNKSSKAMMADQLLAEKDALIADVNEKYDSTLDHIKDLQGQVDKLLQQNQIYQDNYLRSEITKNQTIEQGLAEVKSQVDAWQNTFWLVVVLFACGLVFIFYRYRYGYVGLRKGKQDKPPDTVDPDKIASRLPRIFDRKPKEEDKK